MTAGKKSDSPPSCFYFFSGISITFPNHNLFFNLNSEKETKFNVIVIQMLPSLRDQKKKKAELVSFAFKHTATKHNYIKTCYPFGIKSYQFP